MAHVYPTHCPFCLKFVTGVSRSFCPHCRECFDDVNTYWFNTEEVHKIDSDSCFMH
ncbi:MAG: hypothetical protein QXM31_03495 [Candidatus Woesearchaeota archaeon]